MRIPVLAAVAVVMSFPVIEPVHAGAIERACLSSGRKAANRTLCGCIQDAADLTLSKSQQKKGAKFFKDPHMAQVTRQSDRSSDEKMWKAWKNFGVAAETYCKI